jgi:hypothetical protein
VLDDIRRGNDPRGFDYTEAHRHACEVRFVCALPTRPERAEYLDGVDKRRGLDAGQRLRQDVLTEWRRLHAAPAPSPQGAEPAQAVGAVNQGVNAPPMPADGSFLASPSQGNSNPVRLVVSGVAA